MLGHEIMKKKLWEGRGVQVKGNTFYKRLSSLQTLQVIWFKLASCVDWAKAVSRAHRLVRRCTRCSALVVIEPCIVWDVLRM